MLSQSKVAIWEEKVKNNVQTLYKSKVVEKLQE